MKVKTSITLSDYILKEIDSLVGNSQNRSSFIENAVQDYLQKKKIQNRNQKDFNIINKSSKSLNKEAEDVLTFQVDI